MDDLIVYFVGYVVAFVLILISMYFTNKPHKIEVVDIYWAILLSLFSWIAAIAGPIFLFIFTIMTKRNRL
jgi:steroid 5-alpha reductase family enzyme